MRTWIVVTLAALWTAPLFAATIDLNVNIQSGGTPESEVSNALTILCPQLVASGSTDPGAQALIRVCNEISGGADPSQAYIALSPRGNTSITAATLQARPALPTDFFTARIAALRREMQRAMTAQNYFQFDDLKIPSSWQVAEAAGATSDAPAAAASARPVTESELPFSPWSFYINGEGTRFEQDTLATVAGIKGRSNNVLVGLDHRGGANSFLGAATRLARGSVDVYSLDGVSDGGSLDDTDANLILYGTWFTNHGLQLDFSAGYGSTKFKLSRAVEFTVGSLVVSDTAKSDTQGNQYVVTLGMGYDSSFEGGWSSSVNATLSSTNTKLDGYDESGALGYNLHVESQTLKTNTWRLSGLVQKAVNTPVAVFLPQLTLNYARRLGSDDPSLRAYFISDPAKTPLEFKVKTDDPDYATVGLAMSAVFAGGAMAFIQYERVLMMSHYKQQTATLGWRKEF